MNEGFVHTVQFDSGRVKGHNQPITALPYEKHRADWMQHRLALD
jgi:hypothetical protein